MQTWKTSKRLPLFAACAMIVAGVIVLVPSILFASSILVFIGLGLLFWGALFLFIRPQRSVRSDLMNSTAFSLVKAIDRVVADLGYTKKGLYMPVGKPEKIVVFIPSEPLTRMPRPDEIAHGTFFKDPNGIVIVPPGLALANMIEEDWGVDFARCSLKTLSERLPKLLIEDLEMVKDCKIQREGNLANFRFVGSIYADLCKQCRANTTISSSIGCPFCSAFACVLAMITGKPVSFEKNELSADGQTIDLSFRMLGDESDAHNARTVR